MTFDEFTKLVAEMRHAQKEFFRTQSSSAVDASKALERKVDAALREIEANQGRLFE